MKIILNMFLLLSLLFSHLSLATTISDLQKEDKLKVEITSSTKEAAIGEQVIIKIKVSTTTWFTSGTRISVPQMQNAILLQQNKLATNYSRKENGKTWSHQLWELTFYPQASGSYNIPEIPVTVEISNLPEKIRGTLLTKPITINASLPDGTLTNDTKWLTASKFSMKQKINTKKEELLVGDAIVREIEYNSENALSMFFPDLSSQDAENARLYISPSESKDNSVRGSYTSSKKQKLTYIVQDSGELIIPEIKIYWWDYKNEVLKEETLEGYSFHTKHTPISWLKSKKVELGAISLIIIILLMTRKKINNAYKRINQKDSIIFTKALLKRDEEKLNQMNYKKLNECEGKMSFKGSSNINEKLKSDWSKKYDKNKQRKISLFYNIWISIKKKKNKSLKNKVLKEL